jgi:phosphopentomutase
LLNEAAKPIDACLGIPGLPQSATGQTSLLTGVNAPARIGRHVEGFPGPALRKIVEEENIFRKLLARDYSCTFANAYYLDDVTAAVWRHKRSVTTVAALQAFEQVRDRSMLEKNQAVYQDLTRAALTKRGYAGPIIDPVEAAVHLLDIAEQHNFTLFEYFQTDLNAHRGEDHEIRAVLKRLDRFIERLLPFSSEPNHLFLIVSDHGNIEDSTTRTHTRNPVPFVACGAGAKDLQRKVNSLIDVVPELLNLYP